MPKLKKLSSSTKNFIKTPKFSTAISILAIFVSIASISLSLSTYIYRPTKTIDTPTASNLPASPADTNIQAAIKTVSPSVVSILTETSQRSWFGRQSISTGAGTGFIVSKDGYVITNKHIVHNVNKVTVVKSDGTTFNNVPIVDLDPNNDIAFLKIPDVNDLPAVKLGDSKSLSIGQPVIAIGNALGEFQNTATSGIVSGIGRSITASNSTQMVSENLNDMIQTDASINPGNSGGPLISTSGEVIGVNTAASQTGQGIGFAIPISSIKGTVNKLIKTGKAERPYLGIFYTNINASIAKNYNLPTNTGAYIFTTQKYSAIVKNSPADKAGLKDKDIITAIGGVPVGKTGSISSLIGEYSVGETVDVNILRGDKELSLKITLEPFPKN